MREGGKKRERVGEKNQSPIAKSYIPSPAKTVRVVFWVGFVLFWFGVLLVWGGGCVAIFLFEKHARAICGVQIAETRA